MFSMLLKSKIRRIYLPIVVILFLALLISGCSIITKNMTTDQLVSYVRENIGNPRKSTNVNKAIKILNERDFDNKMDLFYDIALSNQNAYNTFYTYELVLLTFRKENYPEIDQYNSMIEKYTEDFSNGILVDAIINGFNSQGLVLYIDNPDRFQTFLQNILSKDDIGYSEHEMLNNYAEKYAGSGYGSEKTDLIFIKCLIGRVSKIISLINDNSDEELLNTLTNSNDDFFTLVQNYFASRYPQEEVINRLIDVSKKLIYTSLQINSEISRVKEYNDNVSDSVNQARQEKYNEMINDEDVLNEYIQFSGSEESAKKAIWNVCFLYGLELYGQTALSIDHNKIESDYSGLLNQFESESSNLISTLSGIYGVSDNSNTIENGVTKEGGNQSDYILSYSDTRLLTYDDISALSPETISYARNEIYARHGYPFQKEIFKEYFASKDWYQINPDFQEKDLSEIEKANVQFLKSYE